MAASQGPLPIQAGSDSIAILASTVDAVAHSVNGTAVNIARPANAMALELDVTAAAAAVGDTLDVWVQTMIDNTNWLDVAHFTQVLGNGGAKRYFCKLTGALAETMFENATSLSAGSIRNHLGDQWRVRYTIADGGAHGQSFTFAVYGRPY